MADSGVSRVGDYQRDNSILGNGVYNPEHGHSSHSSVEPSTSQNVQNSGTERRNSETLLDSEKCFFCSELLNKLEKPIKKVKCGHTFHVHCMDKYLSKKKRCPICRAEIRWKNVSNKCVVCFKIVRYGHATIQSKCNHKFHVLCLDRFLQTMKRCPICRRDLTYMKTETDPCSEDICNYCNNNFSDSKLPLKRTRCGHTFHLRCMNEHLPVEKKCKVCNYSLPNWINTNNKCVSCLVEFKKDDIKSVTGCSHEFHNKCLAQLLINKKPRCSMCRGDISSMRELLQSEVNSISSDTDNVCKFCTQRFSTNENQIIKKIKCGHRFHLRCMNEFLPIEKQCPICNFMYPNWKNTNDKCVFCLNNFLEGSERLMNLCGHEMHKECFNMCKMAPSKKCPVCKCKISLNSRECSVCLEIINSENYRDAVETPCKHHFHSKCLNTWLQYTKTCPVCRQFVSSNSSGYLLR